MAHALEERSSSDGIAPGHSATVDLEKKRRWFRAYAANKRAEINEQQLADRYYHTKQWTPEENRILAARGQPPSTYNRIKRKIDFLTGVEQRLRRDPKAFGRTPNDTESADAWTAGLRFVADNNDWSDLASSAIGDSLRRGVGVVWIGIERRRQQLEVAIKHIESERFFYDPRSTRRDFSDARYLGVSLWLDLDEAQENWPDAVFEQYLEKDADTSTLAVEESRGEQWADFEHRRVRIVEIWWKTRGQWRYSKFCGDLHLEGGVSPYFDSDAESDQPYRALSPYVDETGVRYGLVRDMKSIQDEINHRRSKALHEVNNRQVFFIEGAIDDEDDLRQEVAKTDGLIRLNPTAEWGKDVGLVDRTKEVRGNMEMLIEAKQEIENLGPNPGLIGNGTGAEAASGRALLAQRDSGMTELQPVFQSQRSFKLRCYRAMHARMRQAWTERRWIRVTDNPQAPQFVAVNMYGLDPMSGQVTGRNVLGEIDVDIILDEGPDTITVQEELFQTIAQLGDAAMSPIGRVLIELSGVTNKKRILELLDQQQRPPEDPTEGILQEQTIRGNEAKIATEEAKARESDAKVAKIVSEMAASDARLPAEIAGTIAATEKTLNETSKAQIGLHQNPHMLGSPVQGRQA
ncbi:MAG: hypothetical protein ACR2PG_06290 [Hyphomicrobiaceae bacterium]